KAVTVSSMMDMANSDGKSARRSLVIMVSGDLERADTSARTNSEFAKLSSISIPIFAVDLFTNVYASQRLAMDIWKRFCAGTAPHHQQAGLLLNGCASRGGGS